MRAHYRWPCNRRPEWPSSSPLCSSHSMAPAPRPRRAVRLRDDAPRTIQCLLDPTTIGCGAPTVADGPYLWSIWPSWDLMPRDRSARSGSASPSAHAGDGPGIADVRCIERRMCGAPRDAPDRVSARGGMGHRPGMAAGLPEHRIEPAVGCHAGPRGRAAPSLPQPRGQRAGADDPSAHPAGVVRAFGGEPLQRRVRARGAQGRPDLGRGDDTGMPTGPWRDPATSVVRTAGRVAMDPRAHGCTSRCSLGAPWWPGTGTRQRQRPS